ncbi:hypothetical protein K6119_12765 [Paracrocinitomix mangrovi]|uniref:hypothetical protein n=1 Tax=Paracrocinitomix mangrovi TaxID=2862509 RepID=UPI001C8DF043|nr:hypothetical protein [Paracrocinitomix mangrovi]UKN00602.1 hypothetical protein K6119_12765 [Paracrocinitomix mangrovi]
MKKNFVLLIFPAIYFLASSFFIKSDAPSLIKSKSCYNEKKDATKKISSVLDAFKDQKRTSDPNFKYLGQAFGGKSIALTELKVSEVLAEEEEYHLQYASYEVDDKTFSVEFWAPMNDQKLEIGASINVKGEVDAFENMENKFIITLGCAEYN